MTTIDSFHEPTLRSHEVSPLAGEVGPAARRRVPSPSHGPMHGPRGAWRELGREKLHPAAVATLRAARCFHHPTECSTARPPFPSRGARNSNRCGIARILRGGSFGEAFMPLSISLTGSALKVCWAAWRMLNSAPVRQARLLRWRVVHGCLPRICKALRRLILASFRPLYEIR